MDQSNLLENIVIFNNKSIPRLRSGKKEIPDSAYALYQGLDLTLNAFKSGIFTIKAALGEGLKILTPKQIALAITP